MWLVRSCFGLSSSKETRVNESEPFSPVPSPSPLPLHLLDQDPASPFWYSGGTSTYSYTSSTRYPPHSSASSSRASAHLSIFGSYAPRPQTLPPQPRRSAPPPSQKPRARHRQRVNSRHTPLPFSPRFSTVLEQREAEAEEQEHKRIPDPTQHPTHTRFNPRNPLADLPVNATSPSEPLPFNTTATSTDNTIFTTNEMNDDRIAEDQQLNEVARPMYATLDGGKGALETISGHQW